MVRIIVVFSILLLTFNISQGQETFPVNGMHTKDHLVYAFTNATVYVDYKTIVDNATLLVQDGKVLSVGASTPVPKGAVVYDLKGKFIYPSLIDLSSKYGMPKIEKPKRRKPGPQIEKKVRSGFGWNQAIQPEVSAAEHFKVNAAEAKKLRKQGFGTVLSSDKDGIARGSSVLVTLGAGKENEQILISRAAATYSFSKGTSKQSYPSSLMGSIALLRQTYLDADWYGNAKNRTEENLSLDAWTALQSLPQIFEVKDKLDVLRADKVGDEFGKQYIIKTGGDGYQRIAEIKATQAKCIVPIVFPKPYDVSDPYDADNVTLAQMKHWELAPKNLATYESNNIEFAITGEGLKKKDEFWKAIRKSLAHGLSETAALKALTYTPANMVQAGDKVGSLKKGMYANFLITSGNLFSRETTIYENWVQGKQHVIEDMDKLDVRGSYDLKVGKKDYKIKVKGKVASPDGQLIISDTVKIKINVSVTGSVVTLSFRTKKSKAAGVIRLNGNIEGGEWKGQGQLPDGRWVNWTAKRTADYVGKDKKKNRPSPKVGEVYYPNMAYGWATPPKVENVLFKNATVWTNESEGNLEGTDVIITNGKITAIGKGLKEPSGGKTIDATGLHLTAGIIDEHSHATISGGGNEGGQAISAEVSIGDIINSDNVNIYRQLAGGVTSAQILHGSANPIGGQSGLIKFRWGLSPEKMKIAGADPFIKFALGENVKQSNWGDRNTVRYPQTRMGVEQLYFDAFIRAKEYDAAWKKYNGLSKKAKSASGPPRRDLELEVLAQILNSERFITCHSYQQGEINMLMHVADSMGFKINTFTHILEGYKVADKMKAHGVGASTFSDWWAYKFEVNDAIPYNGAILDKMGVVTAYNSDDTEMARRLNQEAAKAVKYGGVSQENAWKFVTLNPAKLLHLDDRVGSIKVGKDADVVLWTDNPLSVYAKVKQTYVDGICYYDEVKDKALRDQIRKERARLIQKMIKAKKGGSATQKPKMNKPKEFNCRDEH
ncbi:amidohydrolase family protein [Flavobacteriales bacterium AH-315-E23]|nr:amidohydrolase family protein [Flavobacteriales bacterium AH-315-E23]